MRFDSPSQSTEVIADVEIKLLVSHGDDRGFFREVIRCTDDFFCEGGFAQWSHSKMERNVVKAWHYHHLQHDWWYVPIGLVETVLIDNREESLTYKNKLVFKMGEADKFGEDVNIACVKIPPGVLHGCKVLSEEAHLFYITSRIYDPDDEGRFPFNSDQIDHNWGAGVITAENDRRIFVPKEKRKILVHQ